MPIVYPYIQYGGIWTASQQADAKAAGTWPSPPVPILYAWGLNTNGQLGLGDTTNRSSPNQVGNLTNWLVVSSGYFNNAAVKTDGTLWTWGRGLVGALGLGNTTNYSSPKQVGSLTNWSTVSAGSYFCVAIKTDGTLWAWGGNGNGQLGLGNTTSYSSPKQIGALTNWASVSVGTSHVISTKTDGTIWSWGRNNRGQLGYGFTLINYSSPNQIGALTNWSKITAGSEVSFAIKTDGTIWSWGYNNYGQLGLGNTTTYSSPKQVGALTNWSSLGDLNCQALSVLVIKADGTLWGWGRSNYGQLGLGNITDYSSPKQVGSLTNWSSASISAYESSAIKTDKTLWSWGLGALGELGLGNTTNYSSPKQVGALTNWSTVSVGDQFMLATAVT